MTDSQEDHHQDEQGGNEDPPPGLAEDRLYQALAASQRRRLLYYLLSEEESSVEELATVLSGWDATETGTMSTATDRSELRLALVHSHLPKLDEAGLIDYEANDGSVQLTSLHREIADIIRRSIEAEQRAES